MLSQAQLNDCVPPLCDQPANKPDEILLEQSLTHWLLQSSSPTACSVRRRLDIIYRKLLSLSPTQLDQTPSTAAVAESLIKLIQNEPQDRQVVSPNKAPGLAAVDSPANVAHFPDTPSAKHTAPPRFDVAGAVLEQSIEIACEKLCWIQDPYSSGASGSDGIEGFGSIGSVWLSLDASKAAASNSVAGGDGRCEIELPMDRILGMNAIYRIQFEIFPASAMSTSHYIYLRSGSSDLVAASADQAGRYSIWIARSEQCSAWKSESDVAGEEFVMHVTCGDNLTTEQFKRPSSEARIFLGAYVFEPNSTVQLLTPECWREVNGDKLVPSKPAEETPSKSADHKNSAALLARPSSDFKVSFLLGSMLARWSPDLWDESRAAGICACPRFGHAAIHPGPASHSLTKQGFCTHYEFTTNSFRAQPLL